MWLEYATWSSERNIRAMSGRKSFVIIGGGASGVLLAAHLLRSGDPALRVTVVERTGAFGRGLAYSATLDDHVLNVGAHAMSAFADEPDHFRRWLARNGVPLAADALFFAPRRLYGDYLGAIAGDLAAREPARLRLLHAEAVSLSPDEAGVSVGLADGATLEVDAAILAAGHDDTPASLVPHAVRPGSAADAPLPPDASVMILGTGLSMVDAWLELKARGHRGPETALSRRSLLPRPHLPRRPKPLQGLDVPLGLPPSRLLHWLRGLVRRHAAAGGEWQDVVDGLRPFNQRIWRAWSPDSRQRFLRHAKTWWDVHRHRVAPHIHARLAAAVEAGELRLVAGRVGEVEEAGGGFAVEVLPRHAAAAERIGVARIYDCTGVVRDVASGAIAIVRFLTDSGLARADSLHLGLDVTVDCAVVDAAGGVSERIFALGPLTRGAFFEIEAVPDIRVQAERLAARLTADVPGD